MEPISALSTQFVKARIYATDATGPIDPTTAIIRMALKLENVAPAGGDWKAAAWETHTGPPISYWGKVLVGPSGGAIALSATTTVLYRVWVEITKGSEVAVIRSQEAVEVY